MSPHVTNTSFDGIPSYATGDLLAPHPSKLGLWRVVGRKDDQIIHSNGEKVCSTVYTEITIAELSVDRHSPQTNPVPLGMYTQNYIHLFQSDDHGVDL